MQSQLSMIGWKVKDRVTGFKGVVTHVGLDISGCVQALVHPAVVSNHGEQKTQESRWFDVARLEKIGNAPVVKPIPQKGDLVVAGADPYKPCK